MSVSRGQKFLEGLSSLDRAPSGGPALRLSKAGECSARLAMSVLFPDQALPQEDWSGVARMGNAVHDHERRLISRVFPLRDMERTVHLSIPQVPEALTGVEGKVQGHVDGILELEGEPYLLEIKSMSATFFAKTAKTGLFVPHLWQMSAYMEALEEEGTPVHGAIYMAVNKQDGARHVIEVRRSTSMGRRVREKFSSVVELVLKAPSSPSEVPQPLAEFARSPELRWMCERCPFRHVCPGWA